MGQAQQHEGARGLSAENASSSCTMLTAAAPANDGVYLSVDGAVMGAHGAPSYPDTQLEAFVAKTFASMQAPVCNIPVHVRQPISHMAQWQVRGYP